MKPNIQEFTDFLSSFTAAMASVGTYTARVEKCADRIAKSYGYEVSLTIFVKYFTISVMDASDNAVRRTYVKKIDIKPLNFNQISELSALSWQIFDERLSLKRAMEIYENIISFKPNDFIKILFFISFANAGLCKLFGGDIGAVGCVFAATFVAYMFKQVLLSFGVNLKIQYVAVSFLASFLAYLGVYYDLTKTSDVAIGTSILFLMPGVYLINSVFDILNDNTLVGVSRAISTGILILCIAVGVYATLSICDVGILDV